MTEQPTMAEKTQLPPKISLPEAAGNLRLAQDAVNDAAAARGKASEALRKADLALVQAKHSLTLAERHVVLTALFEYPTKPVPKTIDERFAFEQAWDAKVEANQAAFVTKTFREGASK